ncbi:TauD/TfdA family dioxygenase [Actinomadura montaniterrae]|uniref:TauD/TfdA family dioxygenase n=1 Tax=Actinomadura montaniterrae TaxID=1803903 RepID=A0A6L3VVZ0_9ACTN|nr:TauD/TfdA family dioxygenase [Actinomadura montaniterrae]KAB2379131.1 TauD/TfdA family dioxygenase [Actinomadura montaniterrae]
MPKLDTAPLTENGGTLVSGNGEDLLDLSRDDVLAAFRESGALMFRGFTGGVESFCSFAERFSTRFRSHGGSNRDKIDGKDTLQTVVAGTERIGPHSELRYMPFSPDVLWFYCVRPADEGGETTLYDGARTVEGLKPDSREAFSAKPLKYSFTAPPRIWTRFLEVSSVEEATAKLSGPDPKVPEAEHAFSFDGDMLSLEYTIPAFTRPRSGGEPVYAGSIARGYEHDRVACAFADGTPIPDELRQDIIDAAERVEIAIPWRPGDVVMVDNSRVMHGRRPFTGDREIYTRFAYANFD